MKRILALILPMVLCLSLCACRGNEAPSVDDLIADAPSITGVVTEVHDKYIVVQGEPNELYHLSEEYHVSMPTEDENPHTSYSIGDEVIVYYEGGIAESDPLQINKVLAIEWKNRADNSATIDEKLSAFIDTAISNHYQTENSSEHCCVWDYKVLDTEETNSGTTVYLWVMYKEYSYNDGLQLEAGVHIPAAITAKETSGGYELVEYWEPKDGGYTEDIKEKFPSGLHEAALDSQKYVSEQTAECERKAMEHFTSRDTTTVPSEIPGLTVAYDDTSFAAWLGGHSWVYVNEDGTKNAITADSNHPLECTETMPFIPVYATTVSHAVGYEPAQVTLQFDIEPDKLTVYRYDLDAATDTEGEEIIMCNGYILNLAFGNYLYHIIPEWSFPDDLGGSGDYAFYTKVPEIHDGTADDN